MDGRFSFAPKDEHDNLKPDYLNRAAILQPVDWLPKIQAQKFRPEDAIFEADTPKAAKEKLRAAAPPGATLLIYNTPCEYQKVRSGGG
jgi:hypothetical protein